jgi:hypothetical protein
LGLENSPPREAPPNEKFEAQSIQFVSHTLNFSSILPERQIAPNDINLPLSTPRESFTP